MGLLWLLSFLHSSLFGDETFEELRMASSVASYDQLVRQVEALKKENTHLRRELEDNSNHLSKLENETLDMKEVLKNMQGKLEQEAKVLVSSGRTDLLEQLKALHVDVTTLYDLKYHSPPSLGPVHDGAGPGPTAESSPKHLPSAQKKDITNDEKEAMKHFSELERERCLLLREIDKEEKEKLWYYTQLQGLSKRMDELPHIETFSMQVEWIRQQLEFEAHQIRSLMEERFGTSDEMVQRAQIRASRLEKIEKELIENQNKVQPTDLQDYEKTTNQEEDISAVNPSQSEEGNNLGNKVEMVFWLLSMLATRDKDDMSRTLLAMSCSQESCLAMRKSGCVPVLVQLLHDIDRDGEGTEKASSASAGGSSSSKESRARASAALHNIIFSQAEEGQAKREMRVLHLLEQVRSYSQASWDWLEMQKKEESTPEMNGIVLPLEPQICQAMCAVMKLSFDEEYRRAMNELGCLQTVADLLVVDHKVYGMTNDPINLALRRYTGMVLTNLTFGDVVNKACLCSKKGCMQAIVSHLALDNEELQQVIASILRNLSWRADINSKKILREVGSVSALMQSALSATKESTLKSLLSALWNLSAHSTENKVSICSVEGALPFLVSTLTYKCQSNSLAIIESGGGILRNISSLIATREDYRQILRDHNCLQTLLQHLKSHSLTIVSNACGTLWNLSARSPKDQELLWDMGAVSMLRNLIHSKHKMIAMGSAAALKNLLTNRPLKYKDAAVTSPGSCMPSLYMRKQKALEAELDAKHLAETFDGIEKQSTKNMSLNKSLRHIESLAKDYASDSGCFDDDDIPNVSTGLEAGNFSMLSMFLNSSSFLQGHALTKSVTQRKSIASEREVNEKQLDTKQNTRSEDEVSVAAEKLANKISSTVAKIDKLVEDMSVMHTSSDDSFSLSSEDHCIDWNYGSDELHEARAKSSSPCRLSDCSSFVKRENLSRAHVLLRLKAAHTSLSNDSLNSGSTSDGYCPKEHMKHSAKATLAEYQEELQKYQKRPSRLDLRNDKKENHEFLNNKVNDSKEGQKGDLAPGENSNSPDPEGAERQNSSKCLTATNIHTIKLSPSYQHVPLIQALARSTLAAGLHNPEYSQELMLKKQAWLSPNSAPVEEKRGKIPQNANTTAQESVQKYSVEDTPICFSRCSSLSSLSSAGNVLDGQSHSENEIDSDSSLEIIEVEDGLEHSLQENVSNEEEEELIAVSAKPNKSQPIEIPFQKQVKVFQRGSSPSRNEDMTPSSSSENYIQETPLVMSRCSSVSSLGSFESKSIASSIQSDPCSEMVSGTISPSELPDSPGQTMPPSRSKTPSVELSTHPEKEACQFSTQWENSVKKFMEMTDFKERFQLPPDIDSMIYFTVEKPKENFSCASSLSALPLHEHYIQQDVELKLMHPFQEKNLDFTAHNQDENAEEQHVDLVDKGGKQDMPSDDDIEILKECINSAMPSRFRKGKTSLLPSLSAQVLNAQAKKTLQLPVYMLIPAVSQQGAVKNVRPDKDLLPDDSSFTDSPEGTPVNFSSTASLSDETLQYALKSETELSECRTTIIERHNLAPVEDQCVRDMQVSVGVSKPSAKVSNTQAIHTVRRAASSPAIPGRATSSHCQQERHVQVTNMNYFHQSKAQIMDSAATIRSQNTPKIFTKLDLSSRTQHMNKLPGNKGTYHNTNAAHEESSHSNFAIQSLCHTTPTEEAIYCLCENDSHDLENIDKCLQKGNISSNSTHNKGSTRVVRPVSSQTEKLATSTKIRNPAIKYKYNLILDETPPCYSLSSSLSSLSDMDLEEYRGRTQHFNKIKRHATLSRKHDIMTTKGQHAHTVYQRDSSASSVSINSEDDMVQKCVSSAMSKRKKHTDRRRNVERKQKPKSNIQKIATVSKTHNLEKANNLADDVMSDRGSELGSVEWNAIQEGANSVVTWLQQAAASLSRRPSSESDSVMSFMSGLSAGSPLHFSYDMKDKKHTQANRKESNIKQLANRFQEGKKEEESKTSGNRTSRVTTNLNQYKQIPNLPVVFRGRTVIYMPSMVKDSAGSKPTLQAASSKTNMPSRNSIQSQQRSRSLHRLGNAAEISDLTLPKRSATPPAQINKGSSSGSSRSSTPLRQPQKKIPSPLQSEKQIPCQGVKNINNLSEKKPTFAVSSATKMTNKNTAPKNKTQKSPVRIPFMQTQTRKVVMPQNPLSVQNTAGAQKQTLPSRRLLQERLGLVRMSSSRSSGSESDKSGFLRQLTFIKEPSSLIMRQRSEISSSESVSSLSQSVSPRKSKSDLPAVFLCSSRCQELKAMRPATSVQNIPASRSPPISRTVGSERPPRRTNSESPSRLPVKGNPLQQETFKRYSSSPHISIIRNASSPPSIPTSPFKSPGRSRSQEETKPAQKSTTQQQSQQTNIKGTWKRIKDEDVPHILKSTLPPSALPLVNAPKLENGLKVTQSSIQRKTSDAVVQTEDFPTTKMNSSTSPTLESSQLLLEGISKDTLQRKVSSATDMGPYTGNHVEGSIGVISTSPSVANESHSGGVGHFSPSRHGSPSKAVRVTPFNYVPSPMVASSQIQTSVVNEKTTEKLQT
ncbi:adenomatous polyposis coli protein 2 [Protopterus annectens]|uniref:adenomatous polyposis coli protein 2 n=1 Tax=Protopterus annectens TaxID=7888 RepID=UPI001CFA17B4|nr:adenomatous polyposis coli protein 2 [Protopterus annectens]